MVDLDTAKFWISLLQWALMGGCLLYTHLVTRQRVTESQLEAHKDDVTAQLNGLGQRLARVEEANRHAPTHDHLGEVYERIDGVSGQLREAVGKLSGMEAQLRIITEHLMEKR